MAVDHRERRLFLRQMDKDRDFSQMFDDIGKVSGMILVTVVHWFFVSPSGLRIARAATATSPISALRAHGEAGQDQDASAWLAYALANLPPHPSGFPLRRLEGGLFASLAAGRIGRTTSSPPQLGQMPLSFSATQPAQKVHSKLQ